MNENEEKEIGQFIDNQMTFVRKIQNVIENYGLEPPDFLFLEALMKDYERFPLFHLFQMALNNHEALELADPTQAAAFMKGLMFGYAAGLKNSWPEDIER